MVFLICDTKVRHELASSEYNIRRETCAAAADKMGKPSLRDASIHDLESMYTHMYGALNDTVLLHGVKMLNLLVGCQTNFQYLPKGGVHGVNHISIL